MLRSHAAGSLRATDAGQQVTLAGWVARRRDHGGVIFIDLRDASGVSQVVFRAADVLAQAHRLRAEFCVAVEGVVEIRPEGNTNAEIATGDFYIAIAGEFGRGLGYHEARVALNARVQKFTDDGDAVRAAEEVDGAYPQSNFGRQGKVGRTANADLAIAASHL